MVEKMLRKLHFANGKQILHSSNDEVILNQLYLKAIAGLTYKNKDVSANIVDFKIFFL